MRSAARTAAHHTSGSMIAVAASGALDHTGDMPGAHGRPSRPGAGRHGVAELMAVLVQHAAMRLR